MEHENHYHSKAAWVGVSIMLVATVLGSWAAVFGPAWLLWAGLGLFAVGALVLAFSAPPAAPAFATTPGTPGPIVYAMYDGTGDQPGHEPDDQQDDDVPDHDVS